MQFQEEIKHKLARYITENYVDTTSKRSSIPEFLPRKPVIGSFSDRAEEYFGRNTKGEEIEESVSCQSCVRAEGMEPVVKERELAVPAFLRRTPGGTEDSQIKEPCAPMPQTKSVNEIDDFLKKSFEEGGVAKRLNLYMYERDITTAMIYERCFVDRRLISKITSGTNYHPSKNTMLALCIGLRLNLQEGEEFLLLAGYSFSNTSKYDLIMKFMLQNRIYDLDIINEMLYQYGQPCLGT